MLETYHGDLGGKIGWTSASRATFIGWAHRGGHTLVVTILHCKPLYELTYAARLLNWGFAEDGKVKPVGVLVPPLPAHTVAHPVARPAKPHALPPPARLSLPGIPMLAGLGTLMLASLAGVTVLVITRRRRQAGNPPAG
jgi:D-alanyl-D-alanine carboxypeptidase (penicillin-binding protein 5/6)